MAVIAHLQTRVSSNLTSKEERDLLAENILSPCLCHLSDSEPIFSAYYGLPISTQSDTTQSRHVKISDLSRSAYSIPEIGDACSEEANRVYREVVGLMGNPEGANMWPPKEEEEDE